MKIKRAVFTAGEGLFFFSPSLCHLMLSPLWKQQIYAWSWTGKNWTLLPVGILPWRAGSDERFHPDQIREYSTMSLFSQETSEQRDGARSQGSAGCTPGWLRQFVLCGLENRVRLIFFAWILWTQCARVRGLWSEPRGEDFFTMQLCYVSWC